MIRKTPPATPKLRAQVFKNGEIHGWYRTVWGYSDHLVGDLLDEFGAKPGTRVLDPFCGAGTTLVECMKRGVDSVGVDANPTSCFAARVKTTWRIAPARLEGFLSPLHASFNALMLGEDHLTDPTYKYLDSTGMLKRGWISEEPLRKSICIKRAIQQTRTSWQYKRALMLALLDTVIRTASNVKFGPELYCGKPRIDAQVFGQFERRVRQMASDLAIAERVHVGNAIVVQDDSRSLKKVQQKIGDELFSLVICSPPYPCEHDYTRNSRLELAFLEEVTDRNTLRTIKKTMVRSHTKGIYAGDNDSRLVADDEVLQSLAAQIDSVAATKTHGFARLYSKVATEYFGGMKRHLQNLHPLLKPNSVLAYVVGDQSSYFQVPINTASLLGTIACQVGYDMVGIRHWRDRQSTGTSKVIVENILILKRRD